MFYDRKQHNFLLKDGVAFRSVSSSLFFYEFHAYLLAHMHPLFFKKWVNPGLFFVYFQANNTIFTTNQCEKMSNCSSSI